MYKKLTCMIAPSAILTAGCSDEQVKDNIQSKWERLLVCIILRITSIGKIHA